jgi:hypothetical protein
VGLELGDDCGRQHGAAVFVSLAFADDDLLECNVYIFDAQPQALEETNAATVEQQTDEPVRAVELGEHSANLIAAKDDREPFGTLSKC